jgi:tetratricopeptide (TPR) repeat protein
MGDFEAAVDYLERYDPSDQIVGPMALGALGDAYLELNEPAKAAKNYMRAANESTNDFTSPMFLYKAGMTFELMGKYKDALKAYNRIYKEFYKSAEARTIYKNIAKMKRLIAAE